LKISENFLKLQYQKLINISLTLKNTNQMAKKKAIFFPPEDSKVSAHVKNINDKINAAVNPLGTKYDWTPAEILRLGDFNTKIPTDINAAEAAMQTAQGLNNTKDTRIYDCNLFLNKKGRDMQDHANYDPADLEALGMFVTHVAPDPDAALPKIKPTVLPDMVRHDWEKGSWAGILAWVSDDGTNWSAQPDKDFRSPWEDTRKNKVPNVAETRYYKFRYFDKNEKPVGHETIVKTVVNIS
jgi:hypothetical protein